MSNPSCQQGREDAYAGIYAVIESDGHPRICGGNCRPCGIVRTVLENFPLQFGLMMEPEDFHAFTGIVAKPVRSRPDERDHV